MKHTRILIRRMNNIRIGTGKEYPALGIALAIAFILLSPFVSSALSYLAFIICLYRVVKYDTRVFASDYCALISVSTIFRAFGGVSLLIYLSLFAVVWYIIRDGLRSDFAMPFACVSVLCVYLLIRMQMQISSFVIFCSQLLLIYVLIPKQDSKSSVYAYKTFCAGLAVSSLYGYLFRSDSRITSIIGKAVPAYWGSTETRFQGLFSDSNYYMALLLIAVALLFKLWQTKHIKFRVWVLGTLFFVIFGILTYSKTFFACLVLFAFLAIIWFFLEKSYIKGGVAAALCALSVPVLVFSENSPFSVVLTRITSANNLQDLTTGRSYIFMQYLSSISESIPSLLFGKGMAASGFEKDPHNLYVEIAYYIGIIGLFLFGIYLYSIIRCQKGRFGAYEGNFLSKYMVLIMALTLFFTLHGMLSPTTYAVFFLAQLSVIITEKKE